jgi:hypothetical protein
MLERPRYIFGPEYNGVISIVTYTTNRIYSPVSGAIPLIGWTVLKSFLGVANPKYDAGLVNCYAEQSSNTP